MNHSRTVQPKDLSDSQRLRLLTNLKVYTHRHQGSVIAMLQQLPEDEADLLLLCLRYAFTDNPSTWHDFLIEHIETLFQLAGSAADPNRYLVQLETFKALSWDRDGPLQQRIRALLIEQARAVQNSVRQCAVDLLRYFMIRTDADAVGLVEELKYDADWSVRRSAFEILRTLTGPCIYREMTYVDLARLWVSEFVADL